MIELPRCGTPLNTRESARSPRQCVLSLHTQLVGVDDGGPGPPIFLNSIKYAIYEILLKEMTGWLRIYNKGFCVEFAGNNDSDPAVLAEPVERLG